MLPASPTESVSKEDAWTSFAKFAHLDMTERQYLETALLDKVLSRRCHLEERGRALLASDLKSFLIGTINYPQSVEKLMKRRCSMWGLKKKLLELTIG